MGDHFFDLSPNKEREQHCCCVLRHKIQVKKKKEQLSFIHCLLRVVVILILHRSQYLNPMAHLFYPNILEHFIRQFFEERKVIKALGHKLMEIQLLFAVVKLQFREQPLFVFGNCFLIYCVVVFGLFYIPTKQTKATCPDESQSFRRNMLNLLCGGL